MRARCLPLDPELPEWGDSRYLTVRLTGQVRLADALSHLYVLLPVLDDSKHYWVDDAEIDKLLRAAGAWLAAHPERDLITHRYLAHQRKLAATAVARLAEVDDTEPEALDNAVPEMPDDIAPRALDNATAEAPGNAAAEAGSAIAGGTAPRTPLAQQRRDAVLGVLRDTVLRDHAAARVADLGCGEGSLVALLLRDPVSGPGPRRRRVPPGPGTHRPAAAPGHHAGTAAGPGGAAAVLAHLRATRGWPGWTPRC